MEFETLCRRYSQSNDHLLINITLNPKSNSLFNNLVSIHLEPIISTTKTTKQYLSFCSSYILPLLQLQNEQHVLFTDSIGRSSISHNKDLILTNVWLTNHLSFYRTSYATWFQSWWNHYWRKCFLDDIAQLWGKIDLNIRFLLPLHLLTTVLSNWHAFIVPW